MPRREYVRDRDYDEEGNVIRVGRIVPSLDENISAVERSLKDNGFTCYMPVERKVIRDRRKTNTWTTRRFPLLQGYVFVEDVIDFGKLEDTPGVAGVLRLNGVPLKLPLDDIAVIRDAEAKDAARAERELADKRERATRLTHSKAKRQFPSMSRISITKGIAEGREATVVSTGRDGRLRAIVDGLDALGTVSVPIADVMMLAAE